MTTMVDPLHGRTRSVGWHLSGLGLTAAVFLLSTALLEGCKGGGNGSPSDGSPDGAGDPNATGGVFIHDPGSTHGNWKPSIAVDGAGRLHVAFANHVSGDLTLRYASCATGCSHASSWSSVNVAPMGLTSSETQIAIDRDGRPRVLFRFDTGGNGDEFRLASCDADCTSAGAWKVGPAAAAIGSAYSEDVRSLALDGAGHPGFLWRERLGNNRGVYYARCTAAECSDKAGWTQLYLVPDEWNKCSSLSLAYDSAGRPHLAMRAALEGMQVAAYFTCQSGCEQSANWLGNGLFEAGGAGDLQLRLASGARPRLAFYASAGSAAEHIVFAACDASCGNAASWSAVPVPGAAARDGFRGLDLALDAEGRPRISFDRSDPSAGLALAACDAGCDKEGAAWTVRLAEASSVLDQAYPIPAYGACTGSLWFAGWSSRLAVDGAGQPRVVYGAEHQQGGACPIDTDKMLVRAGVF